MKHIILPTDFSDNSWKAMSYAAQLYHNVPCVFHLLNTFSVPYGHAEVGGIINVKPLQEESENGLKEMLERFKELDHHDETQFEIISRYASLVDAIDTLEESEEDEFLIVMGTRGVSGIGEMFLGTMTTHVISNAKSPVICVPDKADLKVPSKIMFAIDNEGVANKKEIATLLEIVDAHQSNIAVVNVPAGEDVILGKDSTEQFLLDHYFEEHRHTYHTLPGTYKEDALMNFAEENEINLITLIKRDRGFWKNLFHRSLTKSISFYSDIPVLVLRD